MKVKSTERVCGLSGRIYCTIDYLAEPGEEEDSIRDAVEALHPGMDRNVISSDGRNGYRITIVKKGK